MNRELEFKKWSKMVKNQQGNFFDEKTIEKMINQLKMIIPQKINQVDKINKYNSLFDIDDILELEHIKNRLSKKKNGDLYQWDWDEQGHGFGSSAIHRYIKFLKEKQLSKNNHVGNQRNAPIFGIKNIILYGPPGVGKTHNYQRLISMIEEGKEQKEIFDTITDNETNQKTELSKASFQKIKDEKRVEFVSFHQSYSYEDFIEGFRPTEKGNIELEDGVFKRIVKEVKKNLQDDRENSVIEVKNYYMVIDEINRGNISKIFGELITLIEEDKRDVYEVTLPYSKDKFTIPSNLYIIATMNSTDKSIATIDIALRRRFTFLKMKPNSNLVENVEARNLMNSLNTEIKEKLGEDFMLGHSYFMGETIDLDFLKEYKIRPLLEEYFYSDESVDIDKLLKGTRDAS